MNKHTQLTLIESRVGHAANKPGGGYAVAVLRPRPYRISGPKYISVSVEPKIKGILVQQTASTEQV